MNFIALALSSVLAIGSIFGGVQSAQAGTCWFENYNNPGSLTPSYCQTSWRTNANGHDVVDIVDWRGDKVTMVFWVDRTGDRHGTVEVIYQGRVNRGIWYTDSQGDRRVETPGFEMAVRF